MSDQDDVIQGDNNLAIQAIDLNAYYGTFKAVNSVNLSIKRNIVTAFIGPSGCGKSTLLTVSYTHLTLPTNREV